MTRCVLLPGAGTGAANSLIRSLQADYPGLVVVGVNADRFTLRNSKANRNYLLTRGGDAAGVERLREIVEREAVDLLMPLVDLDVAFASRVRDVLPCRVFLPAPAVMERCQDSFGLNELLRSRGVRVPQTCLVSDPRAVDEIFTRLAPRGRAWCRIRRGYGSRAATAVETGDDVRAWIAYWQRFHGVAPTSFTLSEYLPGRDFVCQSLWKGGRLVLVKTVERLARLADAWDGSSSITSLARTVTEPRLVETAVHAIQALDGTVSGAFTVNLREDASGAPCVTGVDAGRLTTMSTLFDFAGAQNMSATYVRLALDEPVDVGEIYDADEAERYFVRGIDTVPALFSAEDLAQGIGDVGRHTPALPVTRHELGVRPADSVVLESGPRAARREKLTS